MKKLTFLEDKSIIGMIHCLPLPGTMNYGGSMQQVIDRALSDLEAMEKAGVDAVIVENFCDKPASAKLSPEQMAALTTVSTLVKQKATIPVGIDAAFCDPIAGLAIAVAVGAQFIRVPVFVDTVITSDGIIHPCAVELQRYRKLLGAEDIALLCDIQTKHTFMLGSQIPIVESAVMARDCGADAIIITGAHTGSASPVETIRQVRQAVDLPLVAGSGVNLNNVTDQFSLVEAAIVGSAMKAHGKAEEPIDYALAKALADKVNAYRSAKD
ncbi:MAG: BtpA/SgcQ family protein [Oscillospiraceae bacterium]|jgi:membrane complex biogenesis BtpA family protein|nr:BtpA/SgcQ family protein [Oscillospiraceae bacterium]